MSWRTATYPSRLEVQDQTTGRQLQRILHYSITPSRPLTNFRRSDCSDVDCDEVYPNVFLGDAATAKSKSYLRLMGITHVLNAAEGSRYGQVDTGHSYYRDMTNVRYMGFSLNDTPTTDISRYFYIAAKFIENGVNSGGRVLVHCLVGVSRSATLVMAYLMISRKMTAQEAIRAVRMNRDIHPNDGFLQQLSDLDNELKRERTYYGYGQAMVPSSSYLYLRESSVPADEANDYYLPSALPVPTPSGFYSYPYYQRLNRSCDLGTRIRIRADLEKAKEQKMRKRVAAV